MTNTLNCYLRLQFHLLCKAAKYRWFQKTSESQTQTNSLILTEVKASMLLLNILRLMYS